MALKRGVSVVVRVGPFVGTTDGLTLTPQTTATLGAADEAELVKHNSTAVVDISGRTFGAITNADGWYALTLTTADVDTPGELDIIIQDESHYLPVHKHFEVLAANVWDSLYTTGASYLMASSSNGAYGGKIDAIQAGTTSLEADVTSVLAGTTASQVIVTAIQVGTTALQATAAAIQAGTTSLESDVTAVQAGTTALQASVANLVTSTTAIEADVTSILAGTTASQVIVTAIQVGTTSLESDVTSLVAGTTALQASTTGLVATAAAIQAGTTSIEGDVTNLVAATTALQSETTGIGDKVTAIYTLGSQAAMRKGVAKPNIPFVLVSTSDETVPTTGADVTVQYNHDGSTSWNTSTGAVTELGSGHYFFSASSSETNADQVVLRFSSTDGARAVTWYFETST